MNDFPFAKTIYPLGLLTWLFIFSWRAFALSRTATDLARANVSLESESLKLDRGSRRLFVLSHDAMTQSHDVEFLQGLPNILPEDKGYSRTQKAIESEVSALRMQVAKRLKNAVHVVVDAKANKLYVKKGLKLLWSTDVSVGRGGVLSSRKTGQRWEFVTPRGEFRVISKGIDAKWRKPDWAFVEAGEPVPPPQDPSRFVSGELGAYYLNLGDGYLIHGTKNEELLGKPASHGCVRVGAADLERLYQAVPLGTKVYIFE